MNIMPVQNSNKKISFGAVRVSLEPEKLNVENFDQLFKLMEKAKSKNSLKFGLTKDGEKVLYFTNYRYGTKAEHSFAKECSEITDGVNTVPMKTVKADVNRELKYIVKRIKDKITNFKKIIKENPEKFYKEYNERFSDLN